MTLSRRRLAIAFVAATVAGCGPAPAPTGTPTISPITPSPRASVTDTPPASVDPSTGWTLVATGDSTNATQFASVAAVPDGFVITGSTGQAMENPIALRSPDGATWTQETITGRPGMSPGLTVAWADRMIATGGGQSARCAHPGGEMDVWLRSADGTWTEAPWNPDFCLGGAVAPVIHDDRVWLIGSGVADVPFLLVSRDGLAWTDHGDRLGDVFVQSAVSAAGDLWVTARAFDGSAEILRSADGVGFAHSPLVAASGKPLEVIATLTVRDRVVLLVTDGDARGILTSDGSGRWTEAEATGLPQLDLRSVQVVDGHLLALSSTDDKPQQAWSSADGSSWTAEELPEEVARGAVVNGVAIADGRAVLVGQIEAPDGSIVVGGIWTGPASLLAP